MPLPRQSFAAVWLVLAFAPSAQLAMHELLLLFYLVVALIVLSVLGYLANRFPWFGLLSGAGCLMAAVHFWQRTSASDFRSEGSAAGLVLMAMFGIFELLLVGIGISLIGAGMASWLFGRVRDRQQRPVAAERTHPSLPASFDDVKTATSLSPDAFSNDVPRVISTVAVTDATSTATAAASAVPIAPAPGKLSGAVKWLWLVLGGIFVWTGARLMLGLSKGMVCGRRGCIDFFGVFAWVKSWGGPMMLGFVYVVIAAGFFFLTYRAFFPAPKPKSWLEKYRKKR